MPVELTTLVKSLSARRAWIEMFCHCSSGLFGASLSARRAWIEIVDYIIDYVNDAVALRKESVDRNVRPPAGPHIAHVALRKESVDRNQAADISARRGAVALRKESVDRNYAANAVDQILPGRSPQGERG